LIFDIPKAAVLTYQNAGIHSHAPINGDSMKTGCSHLPKCRHPQPIELPEWASFALNIK
jgi:hypothetical protein